MSTPSATIARRSRARRFLAVLAEPQSYRNLLYLLLAVPIGTISFCLVVTVVSTGAGLVVVALLGIPVLVAGWYGVRALANLDRRVRGRAAAPRPARCSPGRPARRTVGPPRRADEGLRPVAGARLPGAPPPRRRRHRHDRGHPPRRVRHRRLGPVPALARRRPHRRGLAPPRRPRVAGHAVVLGARARRARAAGRLAAHRQRHGRGVRPLGERVAADGEWLDGPRRGRGATWTDLGAIPGHRAVTALR